MIAKIPVPPPFLKPGDTVAITAMASKVQPESIGEAVRIFTDEWGLQVITGKTIGSSFHDFSAPDHVRLAELQSFLDDPEIKGVFSARGGYGCSKLIDDIDFTGFYKSPKWIVGFSDITALHLEIQTLGFQSIHGPMPKTMTYDGQSNESLRKALFGETIEYSFAADPFNASGETTGQAVGGNLCILAHSTGSTSDRSFDGKILFLEEISEYLYNIDRMFVQLKRAKKLRNLAGVVIGDFSDNKENDEPFGKNAREIILDYVGELNIPVAFGFPFGHENKNLAIRMGENMKLTVSDKGSHLISAASAPESV